MITLVAIPALPLAAAVLSFLWRRVSVAQVATVVASAAAFALSVVIALTVDHRLAVIAVATWIGVNPLAGLILLLQSFVGVTAALYSCHYVPHIAPDSPTRQVRYFVNLNLFQASLFVVPLLLQPALTWVAVELTTVLSVFLVGFDDNRLALEAAWKYAVMTIMGATVAVLGIFLLLWAIERQHAPVQTWTTLIQAAPHMPPALTALAFALILIGLGTKIGLVPMHTWLPDAHSQAPAPVCALLSGVELTTVLYVVMRLWPAFVAVPGLRVGTWAVAVGLVSVGAAAFLLIQVHDFKRMFAYSSVEHMGILLVALGLGPLGVYACMYQLLSHGLAKSLAFYGAGSTLAATGTRDIAGVSGLVRTAPTAAASLMVGSLAVTGAPPFALFLSELSVLRSAVAGDQWLVLALLLLFLAVAFLAIMRHTNRMVFGQPSSAGGRTPASMTVATALAVVPVLVLGVYLPAPLHHLFALAAASVWPR